MPAALPDVKEEEPPDTPESQTVAVAGDAKASSPAVTAERRSDGQPQKFIVATTAGCSDDAVGTTPAVKASNQPGDASTAGPPMAEPVGTVVAPSTATATAGCEGGVSGNGATALQETAGAAVEAAPTAQAAAQGRAALDEGPGGDRGRASLAATPPPGLVPQRAAQPAYDVGIIRVKAETNDPCAVGVFQAHGSNLPLMPPLPSHYPPSMTKTPSDTAELIHVGITFRGRRKVVRHLSSTRVGELVELHPTLLMMERRRLAVVDAAGVEVGGELPLGFLLRQGAHAAGARALSGGVVLELEVRPDDWAD